jgi:hypothetical protein
VHITADQVREALENAPEQKGWQSVTFPLRDGESLHQTYTQYPEGKTYHGPCKVVIMRAPDMGVTVRCEEGG